MRPRGEIGRKRAKQDKGSSQMTTNELGGGRSTKVIKADAKPARARGPNAGDTDKGAKEARQVSRGLSEG